MRATLILCVAVLLCACQAPSTPPPNATTTTDADQPSVTTDSDASTTPTPGRSTTNAGLVVPPGQIELHGTWRGKPFWLRLEQAVSAGALRGRRLQLVYTQPDQTALGGVLLADHPTIVLDERLRLMLWNEDSHKTATEVAFYPDAQPQRYRVTLDLFDAAEQVITGEETVEELLAVEDRPMSTRDVTTQRPVYAGEIWPLIAAIAWQADQAGGIAFVDFLHKPLTKGTLKWQADGRATISRGDATTVYQFAADADGRLASISAADGTVLLSIAGRSISSPVPDEALRDAQEAAALDQPGD